uniref:Uncharacterized protein n=1 Tax=Leersia perrieri TaxID=77586 RepID=A0A0D9XQ86_9ORYZ
MVLTVVDVDKMSSPSLKILRLNCCEFYPDDHNKLSFLNLVSLELDRCIGRAPLLESMPSLLEAEVTFSDDCRDLCKNSAVGDCKKDECEGCYGYFPYDDYCTKGMCLQGLSQATHLTLLSDPAVGRRSKREAQMPANLHNAAREDQGETSLCSGGETSLCGGGDRRLHRQRAQDGRSSGGDDIEGRGAAVSSFVRRRRILMAVGDDKGGKINSGSRFCRGRRTEQAGGGWTAEVEEWKGRGGRCWWVRGGGRRRC